MVINTTSKMISHGVLYTTVSFLADTTKEGDAAFAAIKLTGLGRVEFLVSEHFGCVYSDVMFIS